MLVAYAFSLSLPITIPWTILIAGISIMVIYFATAIIKTNSAGSMLQELLIKPPLAAPIMVFAAVVFFSGSTNGGLNEALLSFFSLRGMLVYFWAYWAFNLNNRLKGFAIAAMLIAGALAGLWATIEQLTGFHPFHFLIYRVPAS